MLASCTTIAGLGVSDEMKIENRVDNTEKMANTRRIKYFSGTKQESTTVRRVLKLLMLVVKQ